MTPVEHQLFLVELFAIFLFGGATVISFCYLITLIKQKYDENTRSL